uniref:Lipocalin n=1 Tax=Rhipicephalus zambeziensis TaxID=60191 RepID=A0A224YNC8_9ACAR
MNSTTKRCGLAVISFSIFFSVRISVAAYPDEASEEPSSETPLAHEDYYEYTEYPPLNLPEFLNTSERTWILKTAFWRKLNPSRGDPRAFHKCQAYNTINITHNETYFSRSYINDSGSNVTETLWGIFKREPSFSTDPYTIMDVGIPGGKPEHEEELITQDMNNTCAVIKITWQKHIGGIAFSFNMRDITYELRVKNSSLRNVDEECWTVFNSSARHADVFTPYSESCQNLKNIKPQMRKL